MKTLEILNFHYLENQEANFNVVKSALLVDAVLTCKGIKGYNIFYTPFGIVFKFKNSKITCYPFVSDISYHDEDRYISIGSIQDLERCIKYIQEEKK